MFEPVAPYKTIEEEFEARTRKAFVEKGMTEVWVYSKRDEFQITMSEFCIQKGWMQGELIELDSQSSGMRYTLTEEGKKHFGLT